MKKLLVKCTKDIRNLVGNTNDYILSEEEGAFKINGVKANIVTNDTYINYNQADSQKEYFYSKMDIEALLTKEPSIKLVLSDATEVKSKDLNFAASFSLLGFDIISENVLSTNKSTHPKFNKRANLDEKTFIIDAKVNTAVIANLVEWAVNCYKFVKENPNEIIKARLIKNNKDYMAQLFFQGMWRDTAVIPTDTIESYNFPPDVVSLIETDGIDGKLKGIKKEIGNNSFVIEYNYNIERVKAIANKMFEKVDFISDEEKVQYLELFVEYGLSKTMQEAIISTWKDYGPELNKKILPINGRNTRYIDDPKEHYVRRCCAHILGSDNGMFPRLRLVGHASVGKDRLVNTLAMLFRKPLDIISIIEGTQKEDVFGAKTIDESGAISYDPEPLIKAMENGTWVCFNEINVAEAGILEGLHKVIDGEKRVHVTGYGLVQAKEGFGFLATMNPSDSNYSGAMALNPATQSRFKTIEIKQSRDIKDILTSECPYAKKNDINACVRVYNAIKTTVENKAISDGFLAVRLYVDALDSAQWISIKESLLDIIAHADTNDHEEVLTIQELIENQIS